MSDGIHRLPWCARTRSNVVFGVLLLMLSLLVTACGAGGMETARRRPLRWRPWGTRRC